MTGRPGWTDPGAVPPPYGEPMRGCLFALLGMLLLLLAVAVFIVVTVNPSW